MKIIKSSLMKEIDKYAIDSIKVPSIILMENAGLGIVNAIDLNAYNNFTIVCGIGNNGGDGLVVARQLLVREKKVDIYIIGNIKKGSKDFLINYNILNNMGIKMKNIVGDLDLQNLQVSLRENDLTIDAIFGLGLNRNINGICFDLITFINKYSKKIYSVDLPSGINGNTGDIMSIAIKADKTLTLHLPKIGLLDREGFTGELKVIPIGIPADLGKDKIYN